MKARQWVLLRGLAREKGHWADFVEHLQKADPKAEIICIDLPGAGIYHRLSSPVTIQGMADFVASHLPESKPKERYLLAISLGGMVATELLQGYPNLCDGMVIINSSFKGVTPVLKRLQPSAWLHLFRAVSAKDEEAKELAVLKMVSNRTDIEGIAKEWASIARHRPVQAINVAKQIYAASMYQLPKEKPPVPVLVLTSEGDKMVSPECSKKLAENWHAPIEIHPTAGHELCLDAPTWVAEKAVSFFK